MNLSRFSNIDFYPAVTRKCNQEFFSSGIVPNDNKQRDTAANLLLISTHYI